MSPDHGPVHTHGPLADSVICVAVGTQVIDHQPPCAVTGPAAVPGVHRLPIPITGRQIPPRRPRTGPPQHPVHHQPMIHPPATPFRCPIRKQALNPRPLLITQIMTILHDAVHTEETAEDPLDTP